MTTEKPFNSMSRKLKELRLQKGLTMREAAKRIGVPETTYREWEYGRTIRGEPYLQIARTFGTTLQELFGEAVQLEQTFESEIDRIINDLMRLKAQVQSTTK